MGDTSGGGSSAGGSGTVVDERPNQLERRETVCGVAVDGPSVDSDVGLGSRGVGVGGAGTKVGAAEVDGKVANDCIVGVTSSIESTSGNGIDSLGPVVLGASLGALELLRPAPANHPGRLAVPSPDGAASGSVGLLSTLGRLTTCGTVSSAPSGLTTSGSGALAAVGVVVSSSSSGSLPGVLSPSLRLAVLALATLAPAELPFLLRPLNKLPPPFPPTVSVLRPDRMLLRSSSISTICRASSAAALPLVLEATRNDRDGRTEPPKRFAWSDSDEVSGGAGRAADARQDMVWPGCRDRWSAANVNVRGAGVWNGSGAVRGSRSASCGRSTCLCWA